jgi:hypothetical protein
MATEAELLASLATLQLDEQRDEAAALYTELGALAQVCQRMHKNMPATMAACGAFPVTPGATKAVDEAAVRAD